MSAHQVQCYPCEGEGTISSRCQLHWSECYCPSALCRVCDGEGEIECDGCDLCDIVEEARKGLSHAN